MAHANATSPAHTPGPFQVFISPGGNLYIAQVDAIGAQVKHLCSLTRADTPGENSANARLFAAAPDLLRALKHASQRLNEIRHYYRETDFKLLRDAIAKAEGQS